MKNDLYKNEVNIKPKVISEKATAIGHSKKTKLLHR